jgi:hypothetical protein
VHLKSAPRSGLYATSTTAFSQLRALLAVATLPHQDHGE